MLERTHRHIRKSIQGLPRSTRTDTCLSLIGWVSIEAMICERKLLFFGRICNLPHTSVSFRILVFSLKYRDHDLNVLGFTADCVSIMIKYNLSGFLDVIISNGHFPSRRTWKTTVKSTALSFKLKERSQPISSVTPTSSVLRKFIMWLCHTQHGQLL